MVLSTPQLGRMLLRTAVCSGPAQSQPSSRATNAVLQWPITEALDGSLLVSQTGGAVSPFEATLPPGFSKNSKLENKGGKSLKAGALTVARCDS